MRYDLPKRLEIGGIEYEIYSDYREILDILEALSDPEFTDAEKAELALRLFYKDFEAIPQEDLVEAVEACYSFIDGGERQENEKAPRLVDWAQDFQIIVSPVNRVIGTEIRALEYLHWWSFLSAFYEIGGECTFAQVVGTRDKLARHKKLDKSEKEWYRKNRKLVDFKVKYTQTENDLVSKWT